MTALAPAVAAAYGSDADQLLASATEQYGIGSALLLLWLRRVEFEDIDSARLLAIAAADNDQHAEGRACLIWLMSREASDAGVANTLLSALMRSVVEQQQWPAYLVAEVPAFLAACATSEYDAVAGETLALLTAAAHDDLLRFVLTATTAKSILVALKQRLSSIAEEDELQDLAEISQSLGSLQPQVSVDARDVHQISLEVELAADRLPKVGSTLVELVRHLKRRALLADALQRATTRQAPLQTLRVIGDSAPSRLVAAFAAFGESVINTIGGHRYDENEFRRVELQCAPAASTPIHIVFPGIDGAIAFKALEDLVATSRQQLSEREHATPPAVVDAFLRLVARMREYNSEVELILTDPERVSVQTSFTLEASWLKNVSTESLEKDARAAARDWPMRVDGRDVPQANSVKEVIQVVDAIIQHGEATVDDVDNLGTPRQIAYYKHGARILGLLDDDNLPTERARALVGRTHSQRLVLLAVYFEDSAIVRGWRRWSGKTSIVDLEPSTALEFIAQTVSGLTGTTIGRRASTLRRWLSELVEHHPVANMKSSRP